MKVKPISAISENIKPWFQSESLLEGGKSREGSKQVTRESQTENTRGSILKGSPKINPTSTTNSSVRGRIKKHNRTRVRGGSTNSKPVCGKQSEDDHLELPGKCKVVLKDDENFSYSMVEAVVQPHQLQ